MPLRIHLPRPADGTCMDPNAVVNVAREGILAWSDVVEEGVPSFRFVDSRGEADIPVIWESEQTGWTIGRARFHVRGGRLVVESIVMVLRYDDGTEAPLDFLRVVMAHEMGHALGLIGHSPYPTDIMCERVRGCLVARIHGLTDRDRNTLRRLYGSAPSSE